MKTAAAILALFAAGCVEQGTPLRHSGDREAFEQLRLDMPAVKNHVSQQDLQLEELRRQNRDLLQRVDDLDRVRVIDVETFRRVHLFLEILEARESERLWLKPYPSLASWPEDVKTSILQNKVTVGMTMAQLYNAWGRPTSWKQAFSGKGESITEVFEPLPHWVASAPTGKWTVTLEANGTSDGKPLYVVTSIVSEAK